MLALAKDEGVALRRGRFVVQVSPNVFTNNAYVDNDDSYNILALDYNAQDTLIIRTKLENNTSEHDVRA